MNLHPDLNDFASLNHGIKYDPSPYGVKIFVCAGRGGDGCLSFDRGPSRPKGGPDGGNGGNGGNVWAVCSSAHDTFLDCKRTPHLRASHGHNGKSGRCKGADGADKVVFLPLGTHIYDVSLKSIGILKAHGQRVMLAQGGQGGQGNTVFKSSTQRRPYKTTKGQPGQDFTRILKLFLMADVGLLGFPSVGKSSLLGRLSGAHPEVGAYPFTTTSPTLGVIRHENTSWETCTMADLPGLIDGAHAGVGLGHDFLEHLAHCRLLLHLVDVSHFEDVSREDCFQDYRLLRKELGLYSQKLLEREEIVVFSKIDTITREDCVLFQERFSQEFQKTPLLCSAKEGVGLKDITNALWERFSSANSRKTSVLRKI